MDNSFWYILGHDYEVTVFQLREEAEAALEQMEDPDYYLLFEGSYGEEFSGWVGRHED